MRWLALVALLACFSGCPATLVDSPVERGPCDGVGGCRPSEICLRGWCVKACGEAADCDATERCTPAPGGLDARSYCACTAQTACPLSEELNREQVCHEAAGICLPPCADNSGCQTGFRCDADAGRCSPAE